MVLLVFLGGGFEFLWNFLQLHQLKLSFLEIPAETAGDMDAFHIDSFILMGENADTGLSEGDSLFQVQLWVCRQIRKVL